MSGGNSTKCAYVGCEKVGHCKSLCVGHYMQLKNGKALTPLRKRRSRFQAVTIEYDEVPCHRTDLIGPCHIYRGGKDTHGYGQVRADGKSVLVHKYVWLKSGRTIPANMILDHECRVRPCCNVNHLRVVTKRMNGTENIAGAYWQTNAAKTHCKYGHEFTPENTRHLPGKLLGRRRCRECERRDDRDCRARKRLRDGSK